MTGCRLGAIDMILLPLPTYGFWYLMVANFKKKFILFFTGLDIGIFVMKLIKSHDGDTILCFEPEKAKALRKILTYYLIAHPCNECLMTETKEIFSKHNVPFDYKTPGYCPWTWETFC
ncbi:uncharacterized protein LOC104585342 [Brachypodium distachyon]|uniref:uncharacterized protein LOC104585342 n=1 Tax=Brachypodium distachyon TaxID=15368 RepID=UPI00071DEF92|nr:uncharacterized protein LOC104585342 [Brachypodium distachyon]XP_014751641.1 uncharacterized protein LOC104585342 [Brachypodium distachyon]XP_024311488.1 uncharacterized protein LOC104585342 [Brachypodium distachyon]|eukprot:XP_014751640.1 uncharacterized protein LOC104585342 [Brachypodium distachyon]